MRVAVATWSSKSVGGVEEYLSILLPALLNLGIDVAFWHELDRPGDRPDIDVPAGVNVFAAPDLGVQESLRRLRAWAPDVIYVHGIHDLDIEASLLDMAPAVFFVHSYAGTCISGSKTTKRPHALPCERHFGAACLAHYFPRGCGGNNPVTMWRLFSHQTRQLAQLRRYSAVLTHSHHMRTELRKHGLAAQAVPYPARIEVANPKPSDASVWRLLYAGRMDFLKGGRILLAALPEIAGALDRRIQLVLAGDGPERADWERDAHQLRQTNPHIDITFTGWLRQEEVSRQLDNADLLIVPSIWPEPFGSVGPMAAQHGVPAAAFAVGGIPDWLLENVSGHLAPGRPATATALAGAVLRCLQSPAHHQELKAGALRCAERFTMARHLPILMDVLRRVAATS
ncbi:MAG TPA: glycosyltransferase family 4 protein [Vicinamibacterales bacterium]|nr:glycosyltransferase family 4 protein [Vicinamibacterales bacterium]